LTTGYGRMVKLIVGIALLVFVSAAGPAGAQMNWRAYNDCLREGGDSTAANVTGWTIHNGDMTHNSGRLVDFETGSSDEMPTVKFTMDSAGLAVSGGGAGGNPDWGTDAYNIFAYIVDFSPNTVYYGNSGWWVEMKFTGLDPAKSYTFVGTAVRSADYPNRITLVTLDDADGYTWSSSDGVGGSGATAQFRAGDNRTTGYIVRWEDIVPGPDGDFSVRSEATSGSEGGKAYPINGFMLAEQLPPGNRAPYVDAGDDRQITLPANSVGLEGSVIDDGLGEPNGYLAMTWSKVSGPGQVTFEPNAFVEDVTARFDRVGEYTLMLSATDGELDANDTVGVTLLEPDCPVGDLNDDCKVDFEDLCAMAEQWVSEPGCSGFGCPDLDGVNGVDAADFALLSQNWLERVGQAREQDGADQQGSGRHNDGDLYKSA